MMASDRLGDGRLQSSSVQAGAQCLLHVPRHGHTMLYVLLDAPVQVAYLSIRIPTDAAKIAAR